MPETPRRPVSLFAPRTIKRPLQRSGSTHSPFATNNQLNYEICASGLRDIYDRFK